MLRPKALTSVLGQANTGGVTGTMLLNREGVLLAYSGYGEGSAAVTGAMVSSVWAAYEREGQELAVDGGLRSVQLECEDGAVAVAQVADLLLCLTADRSTPPGQLTAKLTALAHYLDKPLRQVSMS